MPECRICGHEIRDTEIVVHLSDEIVHDDCTAAPKPPQRRRIGQWAAMGARGQMAMGDVQQDV